jgi:hypothetical protein
MDTFDSLRQIQHDVNPFLNLYQYLAFKPARFLVPSKYGLRFDISLFIGR